MAGVRRIGDKGVVVPHRLHPSDKYSEPEFVVSTVVALEVRFVLSSVASRAEWVPRQLRDSCLAREAAGELGTYASLAAGQTAVREVWKDILVAAGAAVQRNLKASTDDSTSREGGERRVVGDCPTLNFPLRNLEQGFLYEG